ncbi:MAG: DUF2786 domain-containing protein [Lentisphaeria bacterium]
MQKFQSEHQILYFLEREWHNILMYLPRSVTGLIEPPVFCINPKMSCWGRWRGGDYQTLELSSELVWKHPWYAIREVLKHEMAHQLQEYLFPGIEETAHGPKFCECCQMIRANSAASGSYPLMDDVVFSDKKELLSSQEQKISTRIHKLLALSASSDPHEAENALLKAHELMQKYKLSPAESAKKSTFGVITLGKPSGRRQLNEFVIANILNDFYNVRAIWQFTPQVINSSFQRVLAIYGTPADLRIASYIYSSLHVAIDRYWQIHKQNLQKHNSYHAKSDFAYGLLTGFQNALKKQPVPSDVQAMIHLSQKPLENFYNWSNPRIVQSAGKNIRHINLALKNAGAKLGRSMTLPAGLDNKPRKTIKFLNPEIKK